MFKKLYGRSLIPALGIILCSFLAISEIIDFANELWGSQLRLISAIFAENILAFTGFNIERDFTILKLADMTFDIIPACNGSKAIKVTMLCSCLMAVITKDLNPVSKLKLIALSLPLAITLNGLRISALIALSSWSGVIIHADTPMHTVLGLFFFALSIYILTKISDHIISKQKGLREFSLFYPCLLLLSICMIPFLSACLRDWQGTSYNTNDQWSFVFFLWGTLAYIYHAKLSSKNHSQFRYGLFAAGFTLIGTSFIYFHSPSNYVLGIAFLLLISSLNLIEFGSQNTYRKSPLLLIIFCGFPKTNEKIMEILNLHIDQVLVIKFCICFALFTAVLINYKKEVFTCTPPLPKTSYNFIFLLSSLLLGVQLYHLKQVNTESIEEKIYYPYYINDWEGFDLNSEGNEVLNRLYKKDDLAAGLMVISSQGKRQNIHTPEYCQFGIGWDVLSRETITFSDVNSHEKSVSKLKLVRDDSVREFIYWFQSEHSQCASYSEFISQDTLLRIQGKKSLWQLVIVWSDDLDHLENFVKIIPPINLECLISSVDRKCEFPQNTVTKK